MLNVGICQTWKVLTGRWNFIRIKLHSYSKIRLATGEDFNRKHIQLHKGRIFRAESAQTNLICLTNTRVHHTYKLNREMHWLHTSSSLLLDFPYRSTHLRIHRISWLSLSWTMISHPILVSFVAWNLIYLLLLIIWKYAHLPYHFMLAKLTDPRSKIYGLKTGLANWKFSLAKYQLIKLSLLWHHSWNR